MTLRLLIADDQELVRRGFRMILESEPGLEVVAEAADGDEAVDAVRRHRPDVALVDIQMPGTDGLTATERILDLGGVGTRVVILTTFERDDYVFRALGAGASGFVLKTSPPEELIAAVHAAARGDALLSPSVTRRVIGEIARRNRPAVGPRAGAADRAGDRGAAPARTRPRERRDRRRADGQRGDREDTRLVRAVQAGPARPGAGRRTGPRAGPELVTNRARGTTSRT